jgi:hypothetical protein
MFEDPPGRAEQVKAPGDRLDPRPTQAGAQPGVVPAGGVQSVGEAGLGPGAELDLATRLEGDPPPMGEFCPGDDGQEVGGAGTLARVGGRVGQRLEFDADKAPVSRGEALLPDEPAERLEGEARARAGHYR